MYWKIGETKTGMFTTTNASGAKYSASSIAASAYSNGSGTAATVTITNISSGVYKYALTPASADGFQNDKDVSVIVTASIDSVATKGMIWEATLMDTDPDDLSTVSSAQVEDSASAALTNYGVSTVTTAQVEDAASAALANYGVSTVTTDEVEDSASAALANYGAAKTSDLDDMSTLTATNVTSAITDYGTAKTSDLSGLSTLTQAEAEDACDAALTTYDAPTKAEMDAALICMDAMAAGIMAITEDTPTGYDTMIFYKKGKAASAANKAMTIVMNRTTGARTVTVH